MNGKEIHHTNAEIDIRASERASVGSCTPRLLGRAGALFRQHSTCPPAYGSDSRSVLRATAHFDN